MCVWWWWWGGGNHGLIYNRLLAVMQESPWLSTLLKLRCIDNYALSPFKWLAVHIVPYDNTSESHGWMQLFNREKRQPWTEHVPMLSIDTLITHVWGRVWKIPGNTACTPKQYLIGRNRVNITNPYSPQYSTTSNSLRNKTTRSESTSRLTTLSPTTFSA